MPLKPGDLFGKYRILAELGAGGFGEVYHVENTELGDLAGETTGWQVALKIMLPQWMSHEDLVQRFLGEMNLAKKLTHGNGVPIRDVGVYANQIYFTMDLVDGEPLSNLLRNSDAIAPAVLVDWGIQALDFLHYLHTQGHLHRDIKPANLMMESVEGGSGYRVRVLDLGIAREIHTTADQDLTGGGVIGTPEYTAPEYIAGDEPDHSVDIFAMGVVLYQCATGQSPFVGKSRQSTWHNVVTANPTPIQGLRPGFPKAVAKVIHAAMAKAPADRPASALEFAEQLRKALARSQHQHVMLLMACAVVVLLIGAVWYWQQGPTDKTAFEQAQASKAAVPTPDSDEPANPQTPSKSTAANGGAKAVAAQPELNVQLQNLVDGQRIGKQTPLTLQLAGVAPFRISIDGGPEQTCEQAGPWRTDLTRAVDGDGQLRVVVYDANGASKELVQAVTVDLMAPNLASPIKDHYSWSEDDPISLEVHANEPLGAGTSIDGEPATCTGKVAKATITRGSAIERRAVIKLVDTLGNAREVACVLKRARAPEGLEECDGTATDAWGLGWATPLIEKDSRIVVHLQPPTDTVSWSFMVGAAASDALAEARERPQKRVKLLRPFYIGETEVSVRQWDRIADGQETWPKPDPPQWRTEVTRPTDHPAVNMTWREAVAFCKVIGARLPSEAEWEWCARRGAGEPDTLYAWGSDASMLDRFCNAAGAGDGHAYTATIQSGKALPRTGLRHLHGNVIEWCQDVYFEQPCGPGSSPLTDPVNASSGANANGIYVGRGGSWEMPAKDQRISRRFSLKGTFCR